MIDLITIMLCVLASMPHSCSSTGRVCTVLDVSMISAGQKVVIVLKSGMPHCHFPSSLHSSRLSTLLTHTLFFAVVLGNESSLIKSAAGLHCPEFVQVCEKLFTEGEYCLQLKDNHGEFYIYCCHQIQLEELFILDLEYLRKHN